MGVMDSLDTQVRGEERAAKERTKRSGKGTCRSQHCPKTPI